MWDERVKGVQQTFGSKYQITSVCLSDDSQQARLTGCAFLCLARKPTCTRSSRTVLARKYLSHWKLYHSILQYS